MVQEGCSQSGGEPVLHELLLYVTGSGDHPACTKRVTPSGGLPSRGSVRIVHVLLDRYYKSVNKPGNGHYREIARQLLSRRSAAARVYSVWRRCASKVMRSTCGRV